MKRKKKSAADGGQKILTLPDQMEELAKLAYTVEEAARSVGISYKSMYRLIEAGKIKVSNALPKRMMIHRLELEDFLKRTSAFRPTKRRSPQSQAA